MRITSRIIKYGRQLCPKMWRMGQIIRHKCGERKNTVGHRCFRMLRNVDFVLKMQYSILRKEKKYRKGECVVFKIRKSLDFTTGYKI